MSPHPRRRQKWCFLTSPHPSRRRQKWCFLTSPHPGRRKKSFILMSPHPKRHPKKTVTYDPSQEGYLKIPPHPNWTFLRWTFFSSPGMGVTSKTWLFWGSTHPRGWHLKGDLFKTSTLSFFFFNLFFVIPDILFYGKRDCITPLGEWAIQRRLTEVLTEPDILIVNVYSLER